MKYIRFKFILGIFILLFLAGGSCIYAVYHGFILLNNPSRSRFPVRGVDVSHYQGEIDWQVLSQENIRFAYIKATEGSGHVDDKFAQNWQGAQTTQLAVGAYHFFSFDSPGVTQAENFINTVAGFPAMLAPVVDVEYYADKKVNPPDPAMVRHELQIMLDELESHYGAVPIIYSTEDVWERYLSGYFDKYPLWIRNVFTKPQIEFEWTLWQYTNRAQYQGYSGQEKYIDVNVFHGSLKDWEAFIE